MNRANSIRLLFLGSILRKRESSLKFELEPARKLNKAGRRHFRKINKIEADYNLALKYFW